MAQWKKAVSCFKKNPIKKPDGRFNSLFLTDFNKWKCNVYYGRMMR
ncbi:MAG: hypothetical protein FNNCIFGK_01959 [Bacteroidia bacterium]|nr:MAG: hypothetical protein UZ10_BCD003000257 [Bacteroidetes bacterium OLB10]MBV6454695.1 hypothetical protein [Bacteroidia bacterium]